MCSMDKLTHVSYNGKREVKSLASFTQLFEQTLKKAIVVNFMWGVSLPCKHTAFVWRSDGVLPDKGTKFRKDWCGC